MQGAVVCLGLHNGSLAESGLEIKNPQFPIQTWLSYTWQVFSIFNSKMAIQCRESCLVFVPLCTYIAEEELQTCQSVCVNSMFSSVSWHEVSAQGLAGILDGCKYLPADSFWQTQSSIEQYWANGEPHHR